MKKVFCLVLFCSLIGLVGCSEKSRLTTPLMTVAIDPVEKIEVIVGAETNLFAVIRDASGNFTNQPVVWSIDDSNVGVLSSNTSSSTVFTATSPGDAVITLTCFGISSTVEVSVS